MSLKHTIDSILVRETVLIRERPDTVTVERERSVWRERTLHDTIVVVKTDTIVLTMEVEKESTAISGNASQKAHTPGWAWMAVLALAAIMAFNILKVKHKLNNP